ncbi:hypothetical protein BCD49_22125 [Pseudofrankia sp. EUN1h]|nr:hypothetical protein BCD49_22125 [Pseudofrankia sp. EUN1h]
MVSDVTGIPGLGQLGSWLGGLSPFSAAPGGMMPAGAHQLAPYGILGGLIGSLGGSVLGDAIGIPGLGTAGGALGGILIPLSAQQAAAQQAAAQQLAAAQQIAAQHAAVRQHQNAVDALTCGGQPYAGINPHLWQQRWVAC